MEQTTYIVTFEIQESSTRSEFIKTLQDLAVNFYCPIHKNAWAIRSDKKAAEIRDLLAVNLPTTDRLFVIRTGTEAAWKNSYGEKNNEWLKKYL